VYKNDASFQPPASTHCTQSLHQDSSSQVSPTQPTTPPNVPNQASAASHTPPTPLTACNLKSFHPLTNNLLLNYTQILRIKEENLNYLKFFMLQMKEIVGTAKNTAQHRQEEAQTSPPEQGIPKLLIDVCRIKSFLTLTSKLLHSTNSMNL
jgi:hypothetical protein